MVLHILHNIHQNLLSLYLSGCHIFFEKRPVNQIIPDAPVPDGWYVDFSPVLRDKNLLDKLHPTLFVLRPGAYVFPWGENYLAYKQQKSWETMLGGNVLYLAVPDSTQESLWLAQPVKYDWLISCSTDWLLSRFQEMKGKSEELMYRAAIIATSGSLPEDLQGE